MSETPQSVKDLAEMQCLQLNDGSPPMGDAEATKLLKLLNGWAAKGGAIERKFEFDDYYHTIAFVNATAWISNRQEHHPDMEVGYDHCTMRYSTHSVGGLSINDFICAAKVDALLAQS
jgi:4a-hydroxytetrahydrobiopterin dehydratase